MKITAEIKFRNEQNAEEVITSFFENFRKENSIKIKDSTANVEFYFDENNKIPQKFIAALSRCEIVFFEYNSNDANVEVNVKQENDVQENAKNSSTLNDSTNAESMENVVEAGVDADGKVGADVAVEASGDAVDEANGDVADEASGDAADAVADDKNVDSTVGATNNQNNNDVEISNNDEVISTGVGEGYRLVEEFPAGVGEGHRIVEEFPSGVGEGHRLVEEFPAGVGEGHKIIEEFPREESTLNIKVEEDSKETKNERPIKSELTNGMYKVVKAINIPELNTFAQTSSNYSEFSSKVFAWLRYQKKNTETYNEEYNIIISSLNDIDMFSWKDPVIKMKLQNKLDSLRSRLRIALTIKNLKINIFDFVFIMFQYYKYYKFDGSTVSIKAGTYENSKISAYNLLEIEEKDAAVEKLNSEEFMLLDLEPEEQPDILHENMPDKPAKELLDTSSEEQSEEQSECQVSISNNVKKENQSEDFSV